MWPFNRKNVVEELSNRQLDRLNCEVERLTNVIRAHEETYDQLHKDKMSLTEEVEQLKLDKKIAEEDIKHMVKMKEEAMELKQQKYEVKLDGEKATAIAEVKDDYQEKLRELLETQIEQGEARYSEILKRLPDVNVNFGHNLGPNKD